MSIRRLFWLGAAVLFSIAALVAIVAVLGGAFGKTQWEVLATCAIAFVTGSVALAGFACIDRGVILPIGGAAIGLAIMSFVTWSGALWSESDSGFLWKLNGVFAAWLVALLIATTLRLLTTAPRFLHALVPATIGAAGLAALVGTVMIVSGDAGPWQLLAVLVILTLLGYLLTPVLQRFWSAAEAPAHVERVLGSLDGVDVIAVRGDGRSVRIGDRSVRLTEDETVVVRTRL